jgi:hypothetical protein
MAAPRGQSGAAGDKSRNHFSQNFLTTSPTLPQPIVRLDELIQAQVRALWWRQRRDGNRLPAEPGMILIGGGKS